ncbi:MAG TPA: hypothetical protein VG963_33995 [Polyangiaceae bacterium]|nr:hypothetical protein [Polyangiaceae bacterium]HVZ37499.1 hypothetical protein [Polyangiaceae bacterium]
MSQSTHFEPRGVVPPEHLASWVRSQIETLGDVVVSRRIGASRTPLLRVAARLPVTRGTLALVERDYDRENPRAA